MAASIAGKGEPARATPTRKLVAVWGWFSLFAATIAPLCSARAESGLIYVAAPQGYSTADLAANLLQSLAGTFEFALAEAESDQAVMQQVAADPRHIGFVQRDYYVQ